MNKAFFELIRFGAIGASVALFHLAFVFILTDIVGIWYLYASAVSYTIAITVNFILQKFFVHKHMEMLTVGTQFLKYVLLGFFCLVLNTVGMYLLVTLASVPYIYAQAFIIGLLAIFTFTMHRLFIFVS